MTIVMNYRQLSTEPKFEPLAWRDAKETGCYYYAINVKCDRFTLVGDILGGRCTEKTSDYDLIGNFKRRLTKIFNYEVREGDIYDKTEKDEFKIYLEREFHTGYYHFFRQDKYGIWSEKFPGELPKIYFGFERYVKKHQESVNFNMPKGWCFILRRKISD